MASTGSLSMISFYWHLGAKVIVTVHLGMGVNEIEMLDSANVIALRNKIKATFPDELSERSASNLVVRVKDATDTLYLLDEAEAELAEVLKRDSKGKYRVYADLPPKNEGSLLFAASTPHVLGFDNLLDRAEVNMAKTKSILATDTKRPFVNREREIRELCCCLVRNIELCHSAQDQAVTQRKTLVLSAQMFGAGKTTLGSNLLLQLKTNPEYILECKRFLGNEVRDEAFAHLLNSQYVLVDLRKVRVLAEAHTACIRDLIAVEIAAGNYKMQNFAKHSIFGS